VNNYQDSSLWETAFTSPADTRFAEERIFFREQYLNLRKKVEKLVALIPTDIPGLTVHDITHLDALWETASTVAGTPYPLNPAEAYVFGAAILLHDAGMALASYPGGLSDIYCTTEWRDSVAANPGGPNTSEDHPNGKDGPTEPVRKAVLARVLRSLHAKHAVDLPFVSWPNDGGSQSYLIDNESLRDFYGSVIGKIAASHHLPVTKLPTFLPHSVGAISSVPTAWTVDPLKLACLLRAADAAHIDERRAPKFLALLLRPHGVSKLHWNFQGKLAKPRLDSDVLVFTSGPEFGLADADAWWLCFDTISMVDRELRDCDVLLEDFQLPRFAAKRVRGAESPKAMAELIKTKEWEPVDTSIRVADVPRVAEMLGGARLYGRNNSVPIRELIQNATDAIAARCFLEPRPQGYGRVRIWLEQQANIWQLNVEDNGVGMSERTLTETLLDFGNSFWSSEAVKTEFPGLLAKGMKPIGRFGIGFFSVFMLGDIVRVISQRYDHAKESTSVLEFRSGLEMRPILRKATKAEYLRDGGTKVVIDLKSAPFGEKGFIAAIKANDPDDGLKAILPAICPSVEVNVSVGQEDMLKPYFGANDWTEINGEQLLRRIGHGELGPFVQSGGWSDEKLCATYGKLVRPLIGAGGIVYGRACIKGTASYTRTHVGTITVGGFSAKHIAGIGGILVGAPQTAARNSAFPTVTAEVLSSWASEQAKIVAESNLSGEAKLRATGIVMQCGGDPGNLPILKFGDDYPGLDQLRHQLVNIDQLMVYVGEQIDYDEDQDRCHPRDFSRDFEVESSIGFLCRMPGSILETDGKNWPACILDCVPPLTYETRLLSLLEDAWGGCESWSCDGIKVGSVGSYDVERAITVYTRSGAEPEF
jgi:hypothetical protein